VLREVALARSRPFSRQGLSVLLAAIVAQGCASATVETATPVAPSAVAPVLSSGMATPGMASPTAASVARWVVFQGAHSLDKVRRDGTGSAPLFAGGAPPAPAHPDVSPDGSRVVFQAGVDGTWEIWIATIDGSGARVLVHCVTPCINLDAPAWSPDGAEVAFSRLDEHGDELPSSLDVVDVETGVVRTVSTTKSGLALAEPRWSPDGRSLVATLEDHREADGKLQEHPVSSRLVILRLDAPADLVFLTPSGRDASYPDWHPADSRILFEAGRGIWWDDIGAAASSLFVINADGSGERSIIEPGPNDPVVWMPTWTADGEAVLATSTTRGDQESQLVLVGLDGSEQRLGIGGAHAREQRFAIIRH
jgi:Tol biopolymer transport system component